MKLIWTKEALRNLVEIEEFISRDDIIAAENFINKLIYHTENIIEHPEKGRIVPELFLENIREIIISHYRIVYKLNSNEIEIITVFEGHKLLDLNQF